MTDEPRVTRRLVQDVGTCQARDCVSAFTPTGRVRKGATVTCVHVGGYEMRLCWKHALDLEKALQALGREGT